MMAHALLRNLLQSSFGIESLRLLVQPVDLDSLHNCIKKLNSTLKHVCIQREEMENSSEEDSDDDLDLDEDVKIEAILEDIAPRLLSFKLESFFMPKNPINFPRLINLDLHGGDLELRSNEILEILRQVPLLEYVNLYYTVNDPETIASDPFLDDVGLSFLRNFTMTNRTELSSMANVLQRLRFPPKTRVSLKFNRPYGFSAPDQTISTLLDAAALACLTLGEDSIQYMSVKSAPGRLHITGWATFVGGAPRQSIRIN